MLSLGLVAPSAGLGAGVASASFTMIRFGYAECASCHLSPQGAGLLTPYGKGIDEAQSLRARELETSEAPPRRLIFDVRFVADDLTAREAFTDAGDRAETRQARLSDNLTFDLQRARHLRRRTHRAVAHVLRAGGREVGAIAPVATRRVVFDFVTWEGK